MAYRFALSYVSQYPAEKVGPSSFACDETIRNAKFDSSLEALSVPISDIERPMFAALNKQTFTVHVDFINTAASCAIVSIVEVIESFTYTLPNVWCEATNGIVSIRAVLPQHTITVRAILNDIQLVGAVRVGLSGPEQKTQLYTLHELNFNRAFFSSAAKTLAQQPTIQLEITKVSCFSYPTYNQDCCPVDHQRNGAIGIGRTRVRRHLVAYVRVQHARDVHRCGSLCLLCESNIDHPYADD